MPIATIMNIHSIHGEGRVWIAEIVVYCVLKSNFFFFALLRLSRRESTIPASLYHTIPASEKSTSEFSSPKACAVKLCLGLAHSEME